jgi:L-alanine-DL-glutamate epimerase-like enolase superfamily enzyme
MELLAEGFHAIKLRLGRKTLWDDVLATRAVRARIPAEVLLMTESIRGNGRTELR